MMVESKVKVSRTDLALLSHQYDIRVNAATEEPQAALPSHMYDKWTLGKTTLTPPFVLCFIRRIHLFILNSFYSFLFFFFFLSSYFAFFLFRSLLLSFFLSFFLFPHSLSLLSSPFFHSPPTLVSYPSFSLYTLSPLSIFICHPPSLCLPSFFIDYNRALKKKENLQICQSRVLSMEDRSY